jgi:hypothetical protein
LASGGTSLNKGINGAKANIGKETQVVIITDGATSNACEATEEFKNLRETNSVLLIGFGKNYSYDNCLPIVNGDATVFEEAKDSETFKIKIYDRIKTGVKAVITADEANNIYTTVKSKKNRVEFIPNNTYLTVLFDNGLPQNITVDGVPITINYDPSLDQQSCMSLYEFTINDYLKTIGNAVVMNPGEALNSKILAKDLKKRIEEEKEKLDEEIYKRLIDFIKLLIQSCTETLSAFYNSPYEFTYGGGLGRDASNSVGRALSGGLRASSSRGD